MKTNQVMQTIDRELCGAIIKQRTKDEFFNLSNILFVIEEHIRKQRLYNYRLNFSDFLQQQNTKRFLEALEKEIGTKPYIKGAKNRDAWVHPYFAIKILTHFNPEFEIQVYKWLFDYLIKNRIDSGDSFNNMCGVLYKHSKNKALFSKHIQSLAYTIKKLIKCNDWNQATEEQLKQRDFLQNYIADLTHTLQDSRQGVKLGIEVYKMKYLQPNETTIEAKIEKIENN